MKSLSLFAKDKLNQSSGYRSSVDGTDISGCTAMNGFLKKKNSHGTTQKKKIFYSFLF